MAISLQFDEMCSKYSSKSLKLGVLSSQWWKSINNVSFNKPAEGFVGPETDKLNKIWRRKFS